MRVVVLMACLATGCGRLAFDERAVPERTDAGGSMGSGTADATTGTGTFGSMQIGVSTQNTGADRVWLSKFTLAEAAQLQRLVAHLAPGSSTSLVRGVLYSDASGTPAALVGTSADVTVANTSAPDWVGLPFTAPVSLAPGIYWLGTHTQFQLGIAYQSATGLSKFNNDTFSDGADATYAGGTQTFTLELSIYAEYTR